MSIFKRQWISQEVIDYLMELPLMYRIFYRVQTSKDYVASFLFRDDAGKLVADLYAKHVIGIDVQNQDDTDCARIYVEGQTPRNGCISFPRNEVYGRGDRLRRQTPPRRL